MEHKALRYNGGKTRYDLIHPVGYQGLATVLTKGAEKYEPRNWERGFSWSSVLASLKRHLTAFELGEDYDPETGLLHIDHIQCNAHFLSSFYQIYPQGDDRRVWYKKGFKRVYCDLDGVLADFESHFLKYLNLETAPPTDWNDYRFRDNFNKIANDDNFWLSLPKIIEPDEITYPISGYVTSRPCDEKIINLWLKNNGFPKGKLFVVKDKKYEVLKDICDVFIDDSIHNFIECQSNGVTCYLMSRPHNEKFNVGHFRINSFKEFMDILKA